MKNVLIYTGPNKKFSPEDDILAKIQIDNSLDLGWKKEDILIFADFNYEYNGVKSTLIPNNLYYDFDKNANKIPVIIYLINDNLIDEKEIYWCHDLDAYELNKITEEEIELGKYDLALTHYTYKPEWQCSSFFFKKNALDIFELIDKTTRERPHLSRNNEKTITWLIKHNRINPDRYKRLDTSYNITKRYLERVYPLAQKPIKVLHFRPSDKDALMTHTGLDMFMYGKNSLKLALMNDRLIKIFNEHGIK